MLLLCSTPHTLSTLTYICAALNVLESVVECYESLQAQGPVTTERLFLAFTSKLLEKVKKMCKFLEAVKPARAGFPCKGEKMLFPVTR